MGSFYFETATLNSRLWHSQRMRWQKFEKGASMQDAMTMRASRSIRRHYSVFVIAGWLELHFLTHDANQRRRERVYHVMKHSKGKKQNEFQEEVLHVSPSMRAMDRKAAQLCSQIRYTLEYAIQAALKGEYGLTVLEVVPAPNTSHLLVFVQSFEDLTYEEGIALDLALKRHTPALRSAVSESIHRKKTPGLSFQIVPRTPNR